MRRILHCPVTPWKVRAKCCPSQQGMRILPRNSARSVSNMAIANSPAPMQQLEETPPPSELYMRDLPNTCIDWSSEEGRALFREALCLGGLECYFPLAAQFSTQAEPAFCGLGTLAMVLNALNIDPGRVWKGPWRWYHEGMLDCCVPLQVVERRGISIDTFACLARCNGAASSVVRTGTEEEDEEKGIEEFRQAVIKATSRASGSFLIASYSRAALGQTGDGHFSPIGGYHPEKDLVLVLDVARFKYPPHWIPLKMLYKAMQSIDPDTGRTRGYVNISRSAAVPLVLFVFGDRNQQGFWPQQSPPCKVHIRQQKQQQKLFANEYHTAAGPYPAETPDTHGIHTPSPLATAGLPLTSDTPFGSPTSRRKHTMNSNNQHHTGIPSRSQSTCATSPHMEAESLCCPAAEDIESPMHSHGSNCQGQGRSIAGAAYQLRQASRVLDATKLQWSRGHGDSNALSDPISTLNESITKSMGTAMEQQEGGETPVRYTTPPIQAALKCAIHALLCGGGFEMNTGVMEASSDEMPLTHKRSTVTPFSAHPPQGSPIASSLPTSSAAPGVSHPSTFSVQHRMQSEERVCSARSCNLHETDTDDTTAASTTAVTHNTHMDPVLTSDTTSSNPSSNAATSRKRRKDLASPKCFTRLSREQVAAVGALLEDVETLPLYRAIKAELTEGETGVVRNCDHAATSCVKVSTAHMVSILLLTLYSNGDPFPPQSITSTESSITDKTEPVSGDAAVSQSVWETQMQRLLRGDFDNLDIDSVLSSYPLTPTAASSASDVLSSIVRNSLDHSTPLIRSEVALLRSQMDLQLSVDNTVAL